MPYNFRTDRTYLPPRPEQLPIPEMYEKLSERNFSTLYPAWNLQYYVCLCSLDTDNHNIIVETGTNTGQSCAILAQTLKETKLRGHVHSFELDKGRVRRAYRLIDKLGLTQFVTIHVGKSLDTIPDVITPDIPVRFAFIDSDHTVETCLGETELLLPNVLLGEGKFFYDNTWCGPVDEAICQLKHKYGPSGWVDFPNVSRCPNGQIIWQPWQKTKPVPWIDPKNPQL